MLQNSGLSDPLLGIYPSPDSKTPRPGVPAGAWVTREVMRLYWAFATLEGPGG